SEQRRTAWMTFESLGEALDPDHPDRTIEGWQAPVRAIVLARKPG
ncbi:MAG TPA: tRNA 5-methoxyuridine(34)/uridine 5-oxyacetic acid(34) synthase CmoB, partial [Gammaproteobacteria bacterium]|nr:tRNA 5-methoxyuridine(34)/uridine 5-oxyacetic acid(34) synthase CmoB [Gammaproteobacteria bacterium]